MQKNGCAPDSRMLNSVVRRLLQRGEVSRAGVYLSIIDENHFSLEASTASLLSSVSSGGKYQHYQKLLPKKYWSSVESPNG
uniref:Uncharacterized protein n=1 Tax=Arundo donax TaxID=35708 RepID=A0A0A9DE08_ARUDO